MAKFLGPQLIKSDCTVLSNNTAMAGDSVIGCVTSSNGQVAWKGRHDENLVSLSNSIVNFPIQIENITNGLELSGTVPVNNPDVLQGIYECIAEKSPQEEVSLYVGLYALSGKHFITDVSILQSVYQVNTISLLS